MLNESLDRCRKNEARHDRPVRLKINREFNGRPLSRTTFGELP